MILPNKESNKESSDFFNSTPNKEESSEQKDRLNDIYSPENISKYINSLDLDFCSAEELLNKNIPELEWLIQDMVTKRGVTFIAGDTGAYKSGLALHMAMSVASDGVFLKYKVIPKLRVLYVDEEMGLSTIKTRMLQIKHGQTTEKQLDELFFASFNNLKLDSDMYGFEQLIIQTRPNLIILDSLVRFMTGDENSATDAKKCFDTIKYYVKKYGVSFVILHHMRKNGGNGKNDMRGSSDFSAFADNIFISTKKTRDVFELKQVKSRHNPEEMLFKIRIQHVGTDGIRLALDSSENVASLSKIGECVNDATSWMTNRMEFTTKEFNTELSKKHAHNTLFSTLKELRRLNAITQTAHGKYRVNKNNDDVLDERLMYPGEKNIFNEEDGSFNSLDI
jgi:hypothetical protein